MVPTGLRPQRGGADDVTPLCACPWPSLSQNGQQVTLCNACGILYKRGWQCTICTCVYRKPVDEEESWIPCDFCGSWMHLSCEIEKCKETGDWASLEGEHYACPTCR